MDRMIILVSRGRAEPGFPKSHSDGKATPQSWGFPNESIAELNPVSRLLAGI